MGSFIESLDADHIVLCSTVDKRDLDTLADHCKSLRNSGQGNGKDDKLAMSVDGWVINDWCIKKGITFAQFMRDRSIQTRFIEDPDNGAFRIWTGRI